MIFILRIQNVPFQETTSTAEQQFDETFAEKVS